jgi:hypothetical protein
MSQNSGEVSGPPDFFPADPGRPRGRASSDRAAPPQSPGPPPTSGDPACTPPRPSPSPLHAHRLGVEIIAPGCSTAGCGRCRSAGGTPRGPGPWPGRSEPLTPGRAARDTTPAGMEPSPHRLESLHTQPRGWCCLPQISEHGCRAIDGRFATSPAYARDSRARWSRPPPEGRDQSLFPPRSRTDYRLRAFWRSALRCDRPK